MTTIAIAANDQDLTITQKPLLASGDKDSVLLHVDFDAEWDGYTKTAIFYQNPNKAYHVILDMNDECVIPWEVLTTEGTMHFGIYAIKDGTRKTSQVIAYKITKGAWYEDTKPSDPTPDIYTQIMTRCDDVIQAAESVVDLAETANANAASALASATAKVTRSKLAADALYSPIVTASSDYTITSADVGKTISGAHNVGFNVVITSEASSALPMGAEIAVLRYCNGSGGDVTVTFSGVNVCAPSWDAYVEGATIKIPDSYGMIALKKLTTDNMWLVTGNVEVVG